MNGKHILVVEDDTNIRDGLVDTLDSEGYRVTAASDGQEALDRFAKIPFDLVILDIMMPKLNGYDVCRTIRKTHEAIPIIMLTAKGEEIDKVVGLQLGADDYVTKPFGVRELLARVQAVLRRCSDHPETSDTDAPTTLPDHFTFGAAQIDSTAFRGTREDAHAFDLTPREMALIEFFHARPGKVVSRDQLMHDVWNLDYGGATRTVDQHIAQLRKKIEPVPSEPTVITTVHGYGYRYEGS